MQNLGENLLRYNWGRYKFLCFDFESEGLNLGKSKPWELAFSLYDGDRLKESHQLYIKWQNLKVSPGAAKATGFNPQIIERKGKDPKEVIDFFDKFIYNEEYKIVGANLLGFDVYIHNLSRRLLGYPTDYSYVNRIYDTISLARAYKLNVKIPEDKNDFLSFQYRMLDIKQQGLNVKNSTMAKEFGMKIDETRVHEGAYDIEMTMFVFKNLVNKIEIE